MEKIEINNPIENKESLEKMKDNMPKVLDGTNFEIPYEPISIRRLVTRSEFAREIGNEPGTHSFIGRKVNRKRFSHPLSNGEYMVIKTNRGSSPQIFFSIEAGDTSESPIDLENLPNQDEVTALQNSKYRELIADTRLVNISHIIDGTNLKGEENWSAHYFESGKDGPQIDCFSSEQAWQEATQGFEYVSRGLVAKKGEENSSIVLFCKFQSKSLDNDTLFFATEYRDGQPVTTNTKKISLENLPIFEEAIKESPDSLFKSSDLPPDNDKLSTELDLDGLTIKFPEQIDDSTVQAFKENNPISVVKSPIIEEKEETVNEQEVEIDPEINRDLMRTLEALKARFGPRLQEVHLYGSIPRGYKRLNSDIDLLAVVDDDNLTLPLNGFKTALTLIHGELGTHSARSIQYPYRDIEVHTIKKSTLKKPSLKLGYFLNNVFEESIRIYP